MNQRTLLDGLTARKSFFELMRRLDMIYTRQVQAPSNLQHRIPAGLSLIQPADMHFSPSEITSIQIISSDHDHDHDHDESMQVAVKHRNFGMFAPYGPLPIHVTEHALIEKRFERNSGFEEFVNLLSENLAWLYYRAWSSMHPVLGFDRRRNPFVSRIFEMVQADSLEQTSFSESHSQMCRRGFPGVYMNPQRPLGVLAFMLSRYFKVPVQIKPRRGQWLSVPVRRSDLRALGQWRLGSRFWDIQQSVDIEVGPIDAKVFDVWKRRSAAVLALCSVALDYTQCKLRIAIHVIVKTRPELAGKVGLMHLGVDAWLSPGYELKKLAVFENYEGMGL